MSELQFYRSMTGLPLVGALLSAVLLAVFAEPGHSRELGLRMFLAWIGTAHLVGLPYYMAFAGLGLAYLWRKPPDAYRRFAVLAPILFCAAFFVFFFLVYFLGNYGGLAALRATDLPLGAAIAVTILGLGYFYIWLARALLSAYVRRGWVVRHAA